MTHTANCNLSQWDAADLVRREDFNSDNAIIDAELADHAGRLAKLGNCKIVYGSYNGTGKAGEANPCTLTFDGKPLVVIILPESRPASENYRMIMIQGVAQAFTSVSYLNSINTVTWTGNSVQWYYYKEDSAVLQLNTGVNYYVALIAADQ